MERHRRSKEVAESVRDMPLVFMTKEELDATFADIFDSMREDGVVTEYDQETERGLLKTADGRLYRFKRLAKYLKIGIGVSFLPGVLKEYYESCKGMPVAYYLRRERLTVVGGK